MGGVVFYKMSGSGNDFVVLDGRHTRPEELTPEVIRERCDRRFGIGADGLVLLTPEANDRVRMDFWNCDGSRADMCGNAALCSTRLMIVGGLVIAVSPTELFYIGICFSIIDTGFFKPNISTMVGQLYHADDSRRDAGFSLSYAGINLGALLGGILMAYVGKYHSWSWAFALVGVVMTISLINFLYTQRSLGPIGLSPLHPDMPVNRRKLYEIATYIGSLVAIPFVLLLVTNTAYTDMFMYLIGPATLVYLGWEMRTFSAAQNKRLLAALVFILFSVLFWAFFEQSGGSLSLFALNNLKHSLLGIPMDPNVVNNSSNSLFVIAFAAPLGILWVWLAKRKLEPNSVVKFGLGFLLPFQLISLLHQTSAAIRYISAMESWIKLI